MKYTINMIRNSKNSKITPKNHRCSTLCHSQIEAIRLSLIIYHYFRVQIGNFEHTFRKYPFALVHSINIQIGMIKLRRSGNSTYNMLVMWGDKPDLFRNKKTLKCEEHEYDWVSKMPLVSWPMFLWLWHQPIIAVKLYFLVSLTLSLPCCDLWLLTSFTQDPISSSLNAHAYFIQVWCELLQCVFADIA